MLLQKYMRVTVAAVIAAALGVTAWGQAPQKNWKDRAEYDLYASISKEADAAKRLALLDSWKEKYPGSDYALERQLFYIQTHQALQQGAKMFEAAEGLVKIDGKNIQGLYWMTVLTISLADTSPGRLDAGSKAARGLLSALEETFAPDKRPATTPEDAWKKERANLEAIAHTTLGWIAMNRKNNDEAEKEFAQSLRSNPNNGQVSYWLGTVIAAQRIPEKQSAALFHFARAAHFSGEGAMPDANRKQIQTYLERVYTNYHGDKSGLADVIRIAQTRAFPPEDFKIESAAEIAYRREEELRASNPQLALWLGIKKELAGPDGMQYFNERVKNAALPKLRGKVVSGTPAARPREVAVALASDDTPEVTLKLDTAFPNAAPPGTEIEFEGVPQEFSTEPFNLTFEVERSNVSGWPAPPPPAKKGLRKK